MQQKIQGVVSLDFSYRFVLLSRTNPCIGIAVVFAVGPVDAAQAQLGTAARAGIQGCIGRFFQVAISKGSQRPELAVDLGTVRVRVKLASVAGIVVEGVIIGSRAENTFRLFPDDDLGTVARAGEIIPEPLDAHAI